MWADVARADQAAFAEKLETEFADGGGWKGRWIRQGIVAVIDGEFVFGVRRDVAAAGREFAGRDMSDPRFSGDGI
jgi:hypothetical protein